MSTELEIIAKFKEQIDSSLKAILRKAQPVYVRSAPGRVDVLGGLTWQTGGTLAQMAVPHRTVAAIQGRADGQFMFYHCDVVPPVGEAEYLVNPVALDQLRMGPTASGGWQEELQKIPAGSKWVVPILAAVYMLGQTHAEAFNRINKELPWGGGLTIILHSEVPPGANQANTTAMVASVLLALGDYLESGGSLEFETDDLALRVNRAVNFLHPNHSQVIDALTCLQALPGMPAHLLRYSAQGNQLVGQVGIPKDLKIMALDTGVNYSSAGNSVEQLRLAGAMGLRVIETVYRDLGQRHTPLHGHLANLSPALYRQYFRSLLPRRMRGSDFLRTYEPLAEHVGEIVPGKMYRVRAAVDHLLTEHEHAENFLQAIEELADPIARRKLSSHQREKIQRRAGRLLLASHHSYRLRVDLSCREADWLVDHLMESGPDQGIYGARMTGSGGGGTVVVLLHNTKQTMDVLLETLTAYHQIIGLPLQVQEAGTAQAGGALLTAGAVINF